GFTRALLPLYNTFPSVYLPGQDGVSASTAQERFPRVDDFAFNLQAASQQYATPSPPPITLSSPFPPVPPTSDQTVPNQSAGGPANYARTTASPVSRTVQQKKAPNRRMILILAQALLVVLISGSLYYLGFIAQRPPSLSAPQPVAATATADAQAYATATASQGVMFGFDAAHTHDNPYEHTLNS